MLSTLIYRSRFTDTVPFSSLYDMVGRASVVNSQTGVTGILLYDGSHFLQLLEGPYDAVVASFDNICRDARHDNVTELMRDHAPARRFGSVGMELFDLREHDDESVLQAVLERGTSRYRLTYSDRALQFLCTFVEGRERSNYIDLPPADEWQFISAESEKPALPHHQTSGYRFTFQPVVDPMSQHVVAIDIKPLISAPSLPLNDDLNIPVNTEAFTDELSVSLRALRQASALGLREEMLIVRLSAMSLLSQTDAVSSLVESACDSGFVPEQVVISLEGIGSLDGNEAFHKMIRELKASGMGLAVDRFGTGPDGFAMLTRIQPDRIGIDVDIVRDIHASGQQQAVVLAILKFCTSLQVSVVACDVNKAEEWMWLDSAGVANFQGALFAAPRVDGLPCVTWPEMRTIQE